MKPYANYDQAEYLRDTRELNQIARDELIREKADEFDGLFPENIANFASPFQNPSYQKIITNSEIQELYAEFVDRACVMLAEAELKESEFLNDNYRGVA